MDLSLEMGEMTRLNLVELMHQLIEELYPLMMEKNQTIPFAVDQAIYLLGSRKDLARVFENLFVNAIYYGKAHSEIHVRLTESEANVQIEIRNQTDAITQEDLAQLFEMFYTVDRVRNISLKQTGLGLYIAKTIVERHRGEISAQYDDGFIRFIVNLPKT